MSDLAADVDPGVNDTPRKLRMLAVLAVAIIVAAVPSFVMRAMYTTEGVSNNAFVTVLLLPVLYVLILAAAMIVIARIHLAGGFDMAWWGRGRSEGRWTILLVLVVLLVHCVGGWLLRRLNLPLPNRIFWADPWGLPHFVALTICTVVLIPIVEELFWRGYVQETLNRVLGRFAGLLGQAILFAVLHLQPFGGFLNVFVFALMVGWWRWRRKTLVPVILAHIGINTLYCGVRWPGWLDTMRVRPTTDYVSQMALLSKPERYDPNCDAFREYARAEALATAIPEGLDAVLKEYPSTWSNHQQEAARRWVQANAEALEWVARGTEKPYYWRVYSGATGAEAAMPEFRNTRTLTLALLARMQLQALDGREPEMLSDVETLYRYGQHFAGRKTTIDQLVSIHIHTLGLRTVRSVLTHVSLSPDTLASLQSLFEDLSHDATWGMDFTLERLVWLDSIQRMFTDDGKGGGRVPEAVITRMARLPGPLAFLIRPPTPEQREAWRNLDRRQTTQCMETFFQYLQVAARTPSWEWSFNSSACEAVRNCLEENAFVNLLGPPCLNAIVLSWKEKTERDALIATLAAIRYEGDCGQFPASLRDLVDAGYLSEVPRDNFSHGSLSYRRTERGFLLYSWGVDLDDDGGTPSKWGEGAAGGDQVFWPARAED